MLSLTMKTKQKMKMASNAGNFRLDPIVDLKSLSFYHVALWLLKVPFISVR